MSDACIKSIQNQEPSDGNSLLVDDGNIPLAVLVAGTQNSAESLEQESGQYPQSYIFFSLSPILLFNFSIID